MGSSGMLKAHSKGVSTSAKPFQPWSPSFPSPAFKAAVPKLLGTRDELHGRQFSHEPGLGGWFGDDSSTLH